MIHGRAEEVFTVGDVLHTRYEVIRELAHHREKLTKEKVKTWYDQAGRESIPGRGQRTVLQPV